MTPQEFKAWFDGFTEALTGCPNKAQWTRIKERVAEIDGRPVTERVYVDRYWPSQYPRGFGWQYLSGYNGLPQAPCGSNATGGLSQSQGFEQRFDSLQAMYAAGKAEAKAA